MRQATVVAGFLLMLGGTPLLAQSVPPSGPVAAPDSQPEPAGEAVAANPSVPVAVGGIAEPVPWQTAWGLLGLRALPAGLRVAPNGGEYHPNFSIDLNFNC